MSSEILIKQGLDLPMEGAPGDSIREVRPQSTISVFPSEYSKLKFKLQVSEGDTVSRGGALAIRKDLPDFALRSPVAGIIKSIVLGERRSLQEIVIEPNGSEDSERFDVYTVEGLLGLSRDEVLNGLIRSGLLALIRQRPFNRIADPSLKPKSIFVNGMKSAPFRPDPAVLVRGKEAELQAGLNALTRLSDGPVHLNLAKDQAPGPLTSAKNVQSNYFEGPHPAGNTSTHIHHLDPILPGDTVWTLRISDVLRIGEFLLNGVYPQEQITMLAGSGVKEEMRGYVRSISGTPLSEIFDGALEEGEQRIIRGDALSGEAVTLESGLFLYDQGFVVLNEDRERELLGWYAPTTEIYSAHKVVPSNWIKDKLFKFTTSSRGSHRALVLTGIYDKYVPLNIMVDPLSRACIAKDAEEAIALGILETEPEDFALCTFVCPSKTDFGAMVAETLEQIEQEGF